MLEGQVLEEWYTDLNYEENTRISDSREEHLRDVAEDGEDRSKIRALRWDVYTRYKENLIMKKLLVAVLHPKYGNIFGTYVKDNTIEEKEYYKAIGIRGFD